jgi:hypothetical protein
LNKKTKYYFYERIAQIKKIITAICESLEIGISFTGYLVVLKLFLLTFISSKLCLINLKNKEKEQARKQARERGRRCQLHCLLFVSFFLARLMLF